MTQVIGLQACVFHKPRRTLTLSSGLIQGGFPDQIVIKSHVSGREVTFVKDIETAIAHEFWDGEECHYIPVGEPLNLVDKLVIHNAY